MKKYIFLVIIMVALGSYSLMAQEYGDEYVGGWYEDDSYSPTNHSTGIGLQILYGGGINLRRDFPGESAIDPNEALYESTWVWNNFLDVALVAYMPLGDKRPMGVLAEVGLKNLAFGSNKAIEIHVNYIDLGGSFYWKGFFLGATYGITLGGARVDPNGIEDELAADVFNSMIDLKAGYQVQLGKKKVTSGGRFNLVGQISYALYGMNKENKVWTDPNNQYRHRKYNYQPLEVKIGFNYFFDYKKDMNTF